MILAGKLPSKGYVFGGILILLIMVCSVMLDETTIAMSKNALSETGEMQTIFEVPGELVWDRNVHFYNYSGESIEKLDERGHTLWRRDFGDGRLLWSGPGGVMLEGCGGIFILDSLGNEKDNIRDFIEEVRILDGSSEYTLVAGKGHDGEYAAVIFEGDIMWYSPFGEGKVLSGSVETAGKYAAVIFLDEDIRGRMAIFDAQGSILWEWDREEMPLMAKFVGDGILSVAEEEVLKIDFSGNVLWEYSLEAPVCRANFDDLGNTVLAQKPSMGSLFPGGESKLLMLNPQGQIQWSYGLEREPKQIEMIDDGIYVLDEMQILAMTRHGLLTSRIACKGLERIAVVGRDELMIRQGSKNRLVRITGRR